MVASSPRIWKIMHTHLWNRHFLTTSIFRGRGWRKWLRLALAWAESGRCWFAAFDVKSEKFAICNLDADVWGGSFVNSDVSQDLKCTAMLSSLIAKQSARFWRMSRESGREVFHTGRHIKSEVHIASVSAGRNLPSCMWLWTPVVSHPWVWLRTHPITKWRYALWTSFVVYISAFSSSKPENTQLNIFTI